MAPLAVIGLLAVGGGVAFAALPASDGLNGSAVETTTVTGAAPRGGEAEPVGASPGEPESDVGAPEKPVHTRLDVLHVAADYLMLEPEALREQLSEGMSLAEVAEATDGKTLEALKDALTQSLSDKLAEGDLTEDRQAEIQSRIDTKIAAIVTGDHLGKKTHRGCHGKRHGQGPRHPQETPPRPEPSALTA